MRIFTNVTMSSNVSMASNAKDTFTIGSELERDNADADALKVWANANFYNDVTLGSSSTDVVTITGQLTASDIKATSISASGISEFETAQFNNVVITAGNIDGTVIGDNYQNTGHFTSLTASLGFNIPAGQNYKINDKKLIKWDTRSFTTLSGAVLNVTGSRIVGSDWSAEFGPNADEVAGIQLGRNVDYAVAAVEGDYVRISTDYPGTYPFGIDISNANGPAPTDIIIDNKSNGGNIYIKSSGADSSQRIYLSGTAVATGEFTANSGVKSTTLSGSSTLLVGGTSTFAGDVQVNSTLTANGTTNLGNDTNDSTVITGTLKIPLAHSVSGQNAASNKISLNNNNSQIFDDGNMHIHGTSSVWLNSVTNGAVQLNMQTSGDVYAGNNFYMNSGYGSSAKTFGVRAWVNFDGTGATGAKTPRGSGNIASVTKNSTGNYTITFTTAMPDGNYCIQATCRNDAAADSDLAINVHYNTTPSTTSFTIQTARYGSGPTDSSYIMVSVIR